MAADMVKTVRNIAGIPTLISHIRPADKFIKNNIVTVVIPGNPGVIDFYDRFMEVLYEASGKRAEIYGLSHAGHGNLDDHCIPENTSKPLDHIYTLQEQIVHKAAFIEEVIPQNTEMILVGHSIGAYMIIKLLEHYFENHRIIKGFLLFPTIERMADSPSGKVLTPASTYFYWPLVLVAYLLSFLPMSFHRWMIQWWLSSSRRSIDNCVIDAATKIVHATTIKNALSMGHTEMKEVKELDKEIISKHLDKLIFYYGQTDSWVPISYYEDLLKTFPEASAYLCKQGIKHAFVEESSEPMARMVWEWIKDDII